jgi:hypothetical protein
MSKVSLQHAIGQYLRHYHGERNHQGLENRLLRPSHAVDDPDAPVKRRKFGRDLYARFREARPLSHHTYSPHYGGGMNGVPSASDSGTVGDTIRHGN